MQKDEENMDDMEFDILTEIGNIGAGNAVTSLSQMMDQPIELEVPALMHVPKVEMLAFKDLAEILGGAEELVAGILLSLEGDIEGSMLFVLENKAAHHLVHKLMGSDGSTLEDSFTEMEQSALVEIGNIISGAYLTAISQLTNLNIIQTVLSLAIDMAGAILSVPAIEFGKLGDKALLIESQFEDDEIDVCGYFILIPTLESYTRILKSLGM